MPPGVREGQPPRGVVTPMRLSRVTSSASASSLMPCVPAGRIGSAMQRMSAVLSWTRISTPGSTS